MSRRRTSIVVLTHNNLAYTRKCFELLVENTDEYEVIVVDNASKDGTPAFLKEWEESHRNFRTILNPDNRGFAAGCNQGVAAARYGTICLLNNDTEPFPGWLEELMPPLQKGVGAVGAKLLFPDGTLQHCGILFARQQMPPSPNMPPGAPTSYFMPYHRFMFLPEQLLEANVLEEVPAVTAACLLTTKTTWMQVGGMDEGYRVANFEDVDFNLKLRHAGMKVLYQPKSRLIHHWGVTVRSKKGEADSPAQHYRDNFTRLMTKWLGELERGLATV